MALVGGLGTRLRPLTLDTPKQMLPILHRPMLEWVVEGLARHGVDEVVLSIGYRPDAFQGAYPDDRCLGVALRYAVEPEPLDTAGAIRFAAMAAGLDERFIVVNGDVLTDLDVTALVAFHDARGAEATIALHRVTDPSRFGVVPTDAQGRVSAFVEKPSVGEAPTDLVNAGTYVLEPSVVARIDEGRRVSMERETFPALVAAGTLFAHDDWGAYWLDAGTPADYIQAHVDVIQGRRSGPPVDSIHPDAEVRSSDVHSSVVGPGANVGEGTVLACAVVLDRAVIGDGAQITESVIGPGATIGAGAILEGCVIGRDEVVAPDARLHGARIPDGGS
ncbi:MAG: NDP-sugar synthase [Acidimicrobiales bacterium]